MILCYEITMVKKCEQCSAPAVDALSVYCNLCGGHIRDEPEPALPVCRSCGIPAPDDQSVFCTRCGLKFAIEPEDLYPVCTSCGSAVPDELAAFCNRCGTKIPPGPGPALPPSPPAGNPAAGDQALLNAVRKTKPAPAEKTRKKAPGSVVITKKKQSSGPPARTKAPVLEEVPSNPPRGPDDARPDTRIQLTSAGLPPSADEYFIETPHPKKYAHLPLVAEEQKVKDSPQGGYSTDIREPSSEYQKKHAPKKGILGMFKR